MIGSSLPIHVPLSRDSHPAYLELQNPKVIHLDAVIRSLPKEYPQSRAPNTNLWRATLITHIKNCLTPLKRNFWILLSVFVVLRSFGRMVLNLRT
jgi:hypothetical protein